MGAGHDEIGVISDQERVAKPSIYLFIHDLSLRSLCLIHHDHEYNRVSPTHQC